MDKGRLSSEMGGMRQGDEVPVGLALEQIEDAEALRKYRFAIQRMRFNALDTSKNYGLQIARQDTVDSLFPKYLAPGTHGALFVAKDGDRIAGFVALTLSPDRRAAVIDDIWLDEKNHQEDLLGEVLHSTEEYLRAHECESAILRAPNMSEELRRAHNHRAPSQFFLMETGEEGANDAAREAAQREART